MGLDTYAVKPEHVRRDNDVPLTDDEVTACEEARDTDFKNVPAVLCGGMFSGFGSGGSFRGKVYATFIEEVTGISLYTEEIDRDFVALMATRLERYLAAYEHPQTDEPTDFVESEYQPEAAQLAGLVAWFRAAADGGYSVLGWW